MKKTTRCENPFIGQGGAAYGCGKCLPCRLKERRVWTHRIMLEALLYADNAFVTLTYAPHPDPEKDVWSLEPKHHQLFMKSFRTAIAPMRVRFYMVGEYGDRNGRPHFHYVLFGYPPCKRQRKSKGGCNCRSCSTIYNAWRRGFITNDELNPARSRYVARYVVKKMTRYDDPRLKSNQHPEFSRKSLKNPGGIGHGVIDALAYVITRYNLLTPQGDVPVTLQHGGIEWPLGRYLRRKLRKKLGLDERSPDVLTPEAAHAAFHSNEALQAVLMAARNDKKNPSLKHHIQEAGKAARDQMIARHRLFSKGGDL